MVRLAAPGPASSLRLTLANTNVLSPPLTYSLPVQDDAWTHIWYDLSGLVSDPLTLTFSVDDYPAVLLDEVSLGSAAHGGYLIYLPLVHRGW
jgi:hypothetical protein